MSQRSNRLQKIWAELKRKGCNPPNRTTIPVGYDFGCVVARPTDNVATERTEQ